MHRELSSLAEGPLAARIVTFEWLLLCVDVHMLFQVLCKSELFKTEDTNMLLNCRVRSDVSSQGKARCVALVAACHFAFVRSFHGFYLVAS